MKILMVCLGNICRSPLAEGILKHKIKEAGLSWTVESAGTNGFHVGESPHVSSCKVAAEKGINISGQIARKFTAHDLFNYDIIFAMAKDVIDDIKQICGNNFQPAKVKLLMDEVRPGMNLDIPDPWYGNEEGYYPVYEMIESACDAILQNHLNAAEHE